MEKDNLTESNGRRRFLGKLTTGAAAMSIAGLLTPLQQLHANPSDSFTGTDPDEWFKKIKGKHRIIFDVTEPHPEPLPFAWPRIFLLTNEATGTPAKDSSVVVVLRHNGIPYAFEDRIWAKYNLGEVFKINDAATNKPSTRNTYWKPAKGAFKVPGVGEVQVGINELQDSGVMFCVCDVAMTVYSAVVAEGMKMNAADVKKDWIAGLLPGLQVVPSGIWAVGRAQEHGCTYCFAG
jgi:intracellular sulfur oxidation DsrE/DsrF family protein